MPSISIVPTGSAPKVYSTEALEVQINTALAELSGLVAAGVSGLQYKGGWNAGGGSFPAGTVAGDFYTVSTAGTVNSVAFAKGDWLISLVNGASTSTYAANWSKVEYSGTFPVVYDTVAAMLAGTEPSRGTGSIWEADGHRYIEVASGEDLTTAGGVDLAVLPGERGYNVRAFGAVGNNGTDDQPAIQAAINKALNDGTARVYWPAGAYFLDDDLYMRYDATFNAGVSSDALQGGRIIYEGDGPMTRRDWFNDRTPGTVLRFATGKQIYKSSSASRGWFTVWRDMSIIGAKATLVSDLNLNAFGSYENLFFASSVVAANTPVVHIRDNYFIEMNAVDVIGPDEENLVGWGIYLEPSATAGGANVYTRVNASYFDKGLVLGRAYSVGEVSQPKTATGWTFESCQAQFCNIGFHIRQNFGYGTLRNCWAEFCLVAPFKVNESARNITLDSCNPFFATGQYGERGLITIGDDTGTAGVDAAYNITVRNCVLRALDGQAGVFVHDAGRNISIQGNDFYNNGGAAVAVAGGIGGHIRVGVPDRNDYFPEAASAVIALGRRFCTITGTGPFTYATVPQLAEALDWTFGALAADVNASTWPRPPRQVVFNTTAATRTLTLPNLSGANGEPGTVTVMKPFGNNTAVIDAGVGRTIKGSQTLTLSAANSAVTLQHAGSGASSWYVVQET